MKVCTFLAATALTALTALAADPPAPAPALVAKTYTKSLTRVTEKPKPIATEFAGLCSSSAVDSLREKFGPHVGHYVHYYRNDSAKNPGDTFPAGAILVKEKLAGKTPEEAKVKAVAGMIKRAPGTLPKTGDWDFFWLENGKLTAENMQSCAGCHSGAKRDYVFGAYPAPAGK